MQMTYRCYHLTGRDATSVERSNLVVVFKLIIKELLDTSLSHGRMLDDTHAPLQEFFIIIEHVFRHGIKRKFVLVRPMILECW